ncbi:hypothetical protein V1515DRAFT_400699 [Lipomyces mesembrius]
MSSIFREFVESDLPRLPEPPPPPMEIDFELYYTVDGIVNSRRTRKGVEYLIAWSAYDEMTWEPLTPDSLSCFGSRLHRQYPRKPRPVDLDSYFQTSA